MKSPYSDAARWVAWLANWLRTTVMRCRWSSLRAMRRVVRKNWEICCVAMMRPLISPCPTL